MSTSQRPKTLTVRLDDRSHEILATLAKVRGQNKTQVLKRMLREEMAREDLLRNSSIEHLNLTLTEIVDQPNNDKCKVCECFLVRTGAYIQMCVNPECRKYLAPTYTNYIEYPE